MLEENHILRSPYRLIVIKYHIRAFVQLLNRELLCANRPDKGRERQCTGNKRDENDNDDGKR